jgi:hypothetical protein
LEELIIYFHLIRHGLIEKDASKNSSIVVCVFAVTVTFLPSRYLATKGGIYFTEPLPSNDNGIHIQAHKLREGFFKYAVEMGSCATMYTPSFIETGLGIQ